MAEYEGFTHMTDEALVDAFCAVWADGKERRFRHFVAIGFDGLEDEEEPTQMWCITAVDIRDLYKAIKTLEDVYERAIEQVSPEARRAFEADILLESLVDYNERDV